MWQQQHKSSSFPLKPWNWNKCLFPEIASKQSIVLMCWYKMILLMQASGWRIDRLAERHRSHLPADTVHACVFSGCWMLGGEVVVGGGWPCVYALRSLELSEEGHPCHCCSTLKNSKVQKRKSYKYDFVISSERVWWQRWNFVVETCVFLPSVWHLTLGETFWHFAVCCMWNFPPKSLNSHLRRIFTDLRSFASIYVRSGTG